MKIKKMIPCLAAVFVLGLLILGKLYWCPMRFLFGIPCPLCGMVRALKSVLSGNFSRAFYYHPLWPFAVLFVPLIVLQEFRILNIKRKHQNVFYILLAVCVLVCYFVRHAIDSPVVQVRFEESLLYRIIIQWFV